MKTQESPRQAEFVSLLKKQDNNNEQIEQKDEKKQKPIRKVKVKALKGSPYVVSLEDGDVVGEGSFGKVVRAYDMENKNEDLVAKIIPLDDQMKYESMQMELKVLCKLPTHLNLVNYKKIKMSSQNKQYFIMDYCNGGTLTQYLKNQKKISESEIVEFLQQFCRGYRILYKEGIIHRDIKPDNILLHNRIFKIADFGLAKIVDTLQVQNISTRGTPLYIAPELVRKEKASAKVDMWSLGVILYRMMFKGQYPFLDPMIKYDVPTALKHIQSKKLIIPSVPTRSVELINLVKRMLEKDESKRISWEELFNHDLIAFSLKQEENELEFDDLEDNSTMRSGKELLKSSVFLKKMEVIRQSKIKMTPLAGKQQQQQKGQKKYSFDQPQSTKYTTDMDSSSSQEDEEDNQQASQQQQDSKKQQNGKLDMKEMNMKSVQTVIRHSQRRLKSNLAVVKIEDVLLNYREKVLFLDTICLRMSVMNQLVERQLKSNDQQNAQSEENKTTKQDNNTKNKEATNEEEKDCMHHLNNSTNQLNTSSLSKQQLLEEFSILSQQGILLLLEMAMIYNKQLQNFKPEMNSEIPKEDWNEFLMSENILILNNLLKQDRNCLNEFAKQYIQDKENIQFDKNSCYQFINQLNMNRLLEEIHNSFSEMLSLFPHIYEHMGEYKKGFLILSAYLFQAYSLNSDHCVFHTFTRFQDYWAYYEDVEQNIKEEELYNQLIQNISTLSRI